MKTLKTWTVLIGLTGLFGTTYSLAHTEEQPLEKMIIELAASEGRHDLLARYYTEKATLAQQQADMHRELARNVDGHSWRYATRMNRKNKYLNQAEAYQQDAARYLQAAKAQASATR